MEALKQIIEQSFGLRPEHFPPEVQNSVDEVIKLLQQGELQVAEKIDGEWVPRQLHRSERCIDALLCQHRRLHRRKHHGRYLVNGRFLRSSR